MADADGLGVSVQWLPLADPTPAFDRLARDRSVGGVVLVNTTRPLLDALPRSLHGRTVSIGVGSPAVPAVPAVDRPVAAYREALRARPASPSGSCPAISARRPAGCARSRRSPAGRTPTRSSPSATPPRSALRRTGDGETWFGSELVVRQSA